MSASPPPVLLRPRRDADLPALVRVLADQQPVSRLGTARPDWLPDGARDVLLMALPS